MRNWKKIMTVLTIGMLFSVNAMADIAFPPKVSDAAKSDNGSTVLIVCGVVIAVVAVAAFALIRRNRARNHGR